MIVIQTERELVALKLKQLIETLDPIAAKYKQIAKARDAIAHQGFFLSNSGHGDATSLCFRLGGKFISIYNYGEKQANLQELIAMIKGNIAIYERANPPKIYTSKLCDFIDDAVGSDVDCTLQDFRARKLLTVDALRRAIDFVTGLEDCKSTSYYQFDELE